MKKLMVAFAAAATVFVASADDTLLGIKSTFETGVDDSAYWSGDNDGTTNAYDVVGVTQRLIEELSERQSRCDDGAHLDVLLEPVRNEVVHVVSDGDLEVRLCEPCLVRRR